MEKLNIKKLINGKISAKKRELRKVEQHGWPQTLKESAAPRLRRRDFSVCSDKIATVRARNEVSSLFFFSIQS